MSGTVSDSKRPWRKIQPPGYRGNSMLRWGWTRNDVPGCFRGVPRCLPFKFKMLSQFNSGTPPPMFQLGCFMGVSLVILEIQSLTVFEGETPTKG